MLGFAPISGQAISGSPFKLAQIVGVLVASVTLTFGGTANTGLFSPLAASVSLSFGGAATWSARHALTATASFTFGGSGLLSVAGFPVVVTALADSYEVRADRITFETVAPADSYTMRGGNGR